MNNEYNPGQTILGSLKSANKLGNPWHDARNGEFTSGPAAASVSPSSANATKKDLPREHSHAMDFIETHHKDAATIAASLNVPTEMILGLSGIESKWGQGRFAVQGNNYFSQHAGKHVPFQQGSIVSRGDGPMAAFASYLDSGRCFVDLIRQYC
ncbi:glucosaminidase domain-containing protein [Novosphingobium sp.]|uniref:glucosaminidase domain-containing protein n=1 Tax=Novosphingobium sp. TaxID=1874826 RepID=UPI00333E988C